MFWLDEGLLPKATITDNSSGSYNWIFILIGLALDLTVSSEISQLQVDNI